MMKRSYKPLMRTVMVAISAYLALNIVMIAQCHGSPHTLRHAHFQNQAILRHIAASSEDSNDFLLSTTPHWINQTLDHFSPQGSPKFPQRYFEFLDYFNAPNGPIFLTICGESTCPGIVNDYIGVLAKRFGAALVTLEHRYYGYSYPFTDLKTSNLKYLNSKQALSDLATFRNHYQDLINVRYNRSSTSENPWITFGGSYAGALSAWFRLKFPHLTRGSIASSAIVHAIQDYYAFDQQVARSVGPRCTQALQAVKAAVMYYMATNVTYLKSMFDAEAVKEDDDFLSLLADSTALAAQYGFQDLLCRPLVRTFQARRNVLVAYQYYVKNIVYDGFGVNPLDYNRENMKNSTLAGPTSGSNILFTNGSQDPWRHASKQVSTRSEPVVVIKCQNCAHCVDFSGCPQFPFNPKGDASLCEPRNTIDEARALTAEYINLWIRT